MPAVDILTNVGVLVQYTKHTEAVVNEAIEKIKLLAKSQQQVPGRSLCQSITLLPVGKTLLDHVKAFRARSIMIDGYAKKLQEFADALPKCDIVQAQQIGVEFALFAGFCFAVFSSFAPHGFRASTQSARRRQRCEMAAGRHTSINT